MQVGPVEVASIAVAVCGAVLVISCLGRAARYLFVYYKGPVVNHRVLITVVSAAFIALREGLPFVSLGCRTKVPFLAVYACCFLLGRRAISVGFIVRGALMHSGCLDFGTVDISFRVSPAEPRMHFFASKTSFKRYVPNFTKKERCPSVYCCGPQNAHFVCVSRIALAFPKVPCSKLYPKRVKLHVL